MRVTVHIGLKPGVLDPQGKAVAESLNRLGFDEVAAVRVGKSIELDLEDGLSEEAVKERVEKMCEQLLANPVIERYQIVL